MRRAFLFLLLMMIFLTACTDKNPLNVHKYDTVHIEAYLVPTFEDEIGHYKKINSLTLMNEYITGRDVVIFLIEDYYDENDEHIITWLIYSDLEGGDGKVTVAEPKTIFLDDVNFELFYDKVLSSTEKEELTEHLRKIYDEHF
mgnify:CR=1 FL=1